MKIRKGFVSNSSSNSFICDVCGETVSGWDMSLSEAEMVNCDEGHEFCESHIIGGSSFLYNEDSDDYHDDIRYGISINKCPICMLKSIRDKDMIDYMCKYYNTSRKNVEIAIHKKFKTLKELKDYIKCVNDVW